jgi:hypothetical protein
MKHHFHLRSVTRRRPASAALSPIWELIFISESVLGLFGTFFGFGLQFLSGITAFTQALAGLKGDSSES